MEEKEVKAEMKLKRSEILHMAENCVCGKRHEDYGSPEDNFRRIAKIWSAYKNIEFTPEDVAVMMIGLKMARTAGPNATLDSFVDIAGYAACAGEILLNKKEGK